MTEGTVNLDTVTTTIGTEVGEIATAALTVLGAVGATALVLFGAIYAWKYGKKVFSVIAR